MVSFVKSLHTFQLRFRVHLHSKLAPNLLNIYHKKYVARNIIEENEPHNSCLM
jgi:hypothetical protein